MQLKKEGIVPVLFLEDLNHVCDMETSDAVQIAIRRIGCDNQSCGIVLACMSESANASFLRNNPVLRIYVGDFSTTASTFLNKRLFKAGFSEDEYKKYMIPYEERVFAAIGTRAGDLGQLVLALKAEKDKVAEENMKLEKEKENNEAVGGKVVNKQEKAPDYKGVLLKFIEDKLFTEKQKLELFISAVSASRGHTY